MTRSNSPQEDERRAEVAKGRVEKTHGGEVVESIAPEDVELMNDPECKHEQLVRDETETDFNGFICANPDCGVVVLFDKN